MRVIGLLLALTLVPVAVCAQVGGQTGAPAGVIRGRVVDAADGQPLAQASVAVRSLADSTIMGAQQTGTAGSFSIGGLASGSYRVEASLRGYGQFTGSTIVLSAASPGADMGTIRLSLAPFTLEPVEVQAEEPVMVMAPDRDIYNADAMASSMGGTATDLLSEVPDLQVDINGEVTMRGATPRIYLNGRPAPMQGESLALFLEQFPADRIERIEIIANPSARFEAEGEGGIVNIVLKKGVDLGMHGSAFLNGGTRGNVGSGGRITFQKGRLSLMGGGNVRASRQTSDSYNLRENLFVEPVTYLEQNASSLRHNASGGLDLDGEFQVTEKGTLWAETRLDGGGGGTDGLTAYKLMDVVRSPTELYDRASLRDSKSFSSDASVGYRHVIQPDRHELEVELRYSSSRNDDVSRIRQLERTIEGDYADAPVQLTTDDANDHENQGSLQVDYTRPWGKMGQIELGYRGGIDDTDNGQLRQIFPDMSTDVPVSSLDRGFSERETSNAGYLTLSGRMGKFSVQGGLRAELTNMRLELPGEGGSFDNHYKSFFPSAHVTYSPGGGARIRFSYSRRIRRPSASILNPVNRSNDPLNRRVGNPDIGPQYTHSFSLESSWSGQLGSLRLSPYFRRTVDEWTQISTVDDEGVSTETWENLASINSYGTSFTASLRRIHGMDGRVTVSGSREVRDASNLATDYSGSSLRWSAQGNLSARVTLTLNLQGSVQYTPARDVAQGRISSSFMTNFSARQRLYRKKVSLSLRLSDPFDLYRSSFVTRDPSHIQTGRTRPSRRQATLSISYSFGGASGGRR